MKKKYIIVRKKIALKGMKIYRKLSWKEEGHLKDKKSNIYLLKLRGIFRTNLLKEVINIMMCE